MAGPVILALLTDDRERAHAFDCDGLGLAAVGEPAADGVPEPLQVVVSDGLHLMFIPRGGFGWVTGDHEVAPPGTSDLLPGFPAGSATEVGREPARRVQRRQRGHRRVVGLQDIDRAARDRPDSALVGSAGQPVAVPGVDVRWRGEPAPGQERGLQLAVAALDDALELRVVARASTILEADVPANAAAAVVGRPVRPIPASRSQTSTFGSCPTRAMSRHMPESRSPVWREGSIVAGRERE